MRFGVVGDRLVRPIHVGPGGAPIQVGIHIRRIDLDRPAVVGDGPIVLALAEPGARPAVITLGVLRIELDAPLGVGQGLVILALRAPCPAPEVMGKSVTRIQADRLGEVGDGLVPILPVVPEQARAGNRPASPRDRGGWLRRSRRWPRRTTTVPEPRRPGPRCDDQQVNGRGRRDQAGGWIVAVHIPLGLDGGPHEVREKMRVLAEHHRAERGDGPFSEAEYPPHPPFGHLLPGGEKGTVPAPAERVACRGESERTPSPPGERAGVRGFGRWRRARSLGKSFGFARSHPVKNSSA